MRYVHHAFKTLIVGGITLLLFEFGTAAAATMNIEKQAFGTLPDGTPVDLYTLTNANGNQVSITNYEGIVLSLTVPDHQGNLEDVVLGYDTLEDYITHNPYFGGITDTILGVLDHVVWSAREFTSDEGVSLELTASTGQERDFLGILTATVVYTWTNKDELKIDHTVTTDQEVQVNITNRIYFNLAGAGAGNILDHELMIHGESFYPIDPHTLRPLGERRQVRYTVMDFYTQPTRIGTGMEQNEPQMRLTGGYSHFWELENRNVPSSPDEQLPLAARVYEPSSKRVLEVRTLASGIWLETGNFLDGTLTGKDNTTYTRHYGFTLSPENLSIAADDPDFPAATVLEPGRPYTHTIVYKFFAL